MLQFFKKILYNIHTRVVIFLLVRGISFPGVNHVKKKMGSTYQKFERQKLVYDIKSEQFSISIGPFWFRTLIEKCLIFFRRNKFIILIFFKITISVVCIMGPIFFFILIHGILPVPDRVPYEVPQTKLASQSNMRVDFPYTDDNFVNDHQAKDFGIGFFPVKFNILNGFIVSENKELILNNTIRNEFSNNDKNDASVLRVSYYLKPSGVSKKISCVLQIFNSNNELLAQTTDLTPVIESYSKYSIRNSWRKAFTPNLIPSYGQIRELKIPIARMLPNQLIVKSLNPNPLSITDTNTGQCAFIVSDFSFEHPVKTSLPRRGVIFIVVHSLRANTAYDSKLMPKLNHYIKNGGLSFLEHRAQSNETTSSILSLLTSEYPTEFSYNSKFLPLFLQNLGYRVGAIGDISSLIDPDTGKNYLGIHNAIIAAHLRYGGRHITELSGQWLEKYGNAPFFLYLHYNTLNYPFKPPFANLDFLKLMQQPFGLNQKQQMYKGLIRYLDLELQTLFQKLKDLGIFDDVDIILTSDHGIQLDKKNWGLLTDSNRNLKGAYAGKGHSLFDEEIRVPLMIKIAGNHFPIHTKITQPSAHLDLFPTIYSFMGGDVKNIHVRGLDFSNAFESKNFMKNISDIFQARKFLFIDALQYSGVFGWDIENLSNPTKYIKQLTPDSTTLYLPQAPWEEKITWYQPEFFTKIDFNSHSEILMPDLPNDEQEKIRKVYDTMRE